MDWSFGDAAPTVSDMRVSDKTLSHWGDVSEDIDYTLAKRRRAIFGSCTPHTPVVRTAKSFHAARRLNGHRGCVNRLCWHPTGDVLASVSDDRRAILWKYNKLSVLGHPDCEVNLDENAGEDVSVHSWYRTSYRPIRTNEQLLSRDDHKLVIKTQHRANIFGVRFLPSNPLAGSFSEFDSLVTGGLDHQTHVYKIATGTPLNLYRCNGGAVTSISTSLYSSFLFWTSSDEGVVREFDCRQPHSCRGDHDCPNVLISTHLGSTLPDIRSLRWVPSSPQKRKLYEKHLTQLERNFTSPRFDIVEARTRFLGIALSFQVTPNDAVDIVRVARQIMPMRDRRDRSSRVLSMAVNPLRPEYILVAASDPLLRVFDRRMLSIGRRTGWPEDSLVLGSVPVAAFSPTPIGFDPTGDVPGDVRNVAEYLACRDSDLKYATHVEWDPKGNMIMGAFQNDAVYTFNFALETSGGDSQGIYGTHMPPSPKKSRTPKSRYFVALQMMKAAAARQTGPVAFRKRLTEISLLLDGAEFALVSAAPETSGHSYLVRCEAVLRPNLDTVNVWVSEAGRLAGLSVEQLNKMLQDDRIFTTTYTIMCAGLFGAESRDARKMLQLLRRLHDLIVRHTLSRLSRPLLGPNEQGWLSWAWTHSLKALAAEDLDGQKAPLLLGRTLTKRHEWSVLAALYKYARDAALEGASSGADVPQLVSLLENVYNALRRFHEKETETLERIGSRTLLPRELFGAPPDRSVILRHLSTHWDRHTLTSSSSSSSESSTVDTGLTPDHFEDAHSRWSFRSPSLQTACPRLHNNQNQPSRDDLIYRFNRKSLSRLVCNEHVKSGHSPFQPHLLVGLTAERRFGFHSLKRALKTQTEYVENSDDDDQASRDLEFRSMQLIEKFDPMTFRAIPEYQRYEGAVNRITDVKECAFWGSKYVIGASDGGAVFVWRRSDALLVDVLCGHASSVNCVRPHPTEPVMASSGMDHYILLWHASNECDDQVASQEEEH